jgi:hypothetical protein
VSIVSAWVMVMRVYGGGRFAPEQGAEEVFVVELWLSFAEVLREFFSHVCCWSPFRVLIIG